MLKESKYPVRDIYKCYALGLPVKRLMKLKQKFIHDFLIFNDGIAVYVHLRDLKMRPVAGIFWNSERPDFTIQPRFGAER